MYAFTAHLLLLSPLPAGPHRRASNPLISGVRLRSQSHHHKESSPFMKLFASLFLLVASAIAQGPKQGVITGSWEGNATVHGQQVPVRLEISGGGSNLRTALLNGPESSPASSAVFTGNHLLVTFNYYARTLDATLANGILTGSFGTAATRYPVSLSSHGVAENSSGPRAQN